jgi:PPOX class probable F420-dependent enzyme
MSDMTPSRPFMPDYGVAAPDEGTGLLPWDWATERLGTSREYWVATVRPDGAPSVTPVWGVWRDGAVWFSCGPASRKARNLASEPRCAVTTNDGAEPVVVEGTAERSTETEEFAKAVHEKYGTPYDPEFFARNALYRVVPAKVLGLVESDFTGSPTRWLPTPPPTPGAAR